MIKAGIAYTAPVHMGQFLLNLISATATGFFYDPRPKAEAGVSVRYRY
jgi:hypothetical protein